MKILSILLLIGLSFCTAWSKTDCPSYKVFYIPLDWQTYVPVKSVEGEAFAKFELVSCNISNIFDQMAKEKTLGKSDLMDLRVDIRDSNGNQFYITQTRRVVCEGQVKAIDPKIVDEALKQIEKKANLDEKGKPKKNLPSNQSDTKKNR